MTKHTIGNWQIHDSNGDGNNLIKANGETIALVYGSAKKLEHCYNAFLIASAPEMHQALKHAEVVLHNLRVCNLGELTQQQELLEREIKSALTKANPKS